MPRRFGKLTTYPEGTEAPADTKTLESVWDWITRQPEAARRAEEREGPSPGEKGILSLMRWPPGTEFDPSKIGPGLSSAAGGTMSALKEGYDPRNWMKRDPRNVKEKAPQPLTYDIQPPPKMLPDFAELPPEKQKEALKLKAAVEERGPETWAPGMTVEEILGVRNVPDVPELPERPEPSLYEQAPFERAWRHYTGVPLPETPLTPEQEMRVKQQMIDQRFDQMLPAELTAEEKARVEQAVGGGGAAPGEAPLPPEDVTSPGALPDTGADLPASLMDLTRPPLDLSRPPEPGAPSPATEPELLASTLRGNRDVVDRGREERMLAEQPSQDPFQTLAQQDMQRRKDIMLEEGLENLSQGLFGLAGAPVPGKSARSEARDRLLPSERKFLSEQLGMDIPEGMDFSRLHASYPALAQALRARAGARDDMLQSQEDRREVLYDVRQDLLRRPDLVKIREMHGEGGTVQNLLRIGGGQASKAVMTAMAKLAGDTGRLSDQDIARWAARMGLEGGWDKIVNTFASRPSEGWTKEMKQVAKELTEKHAAAYNDLIRGEIEALENLKGIPQSEARNALNDLFLPVDESAKDMPKNKQFTLPDGTTGVIGKTVITLPNGRKAVVKNYNPITTDIDFEYQ